MLKERHKVETKGSIAVVIAFRTARRMRQKLTAEDWVLAGYE